MSAWVSQWIWNETALSNLKLGPAVERDERLAVELERTTITEPGRLPMNLLPGFTDSG